MKYLNLSPFIPIRSGSAKRNWVVAGVAFLFAGYRDTARIFRNIAGRPKYYRWQPASRYESSQSEPHRAATYRQWYREQHHPRQRCHASGHELSRGSAD